MFDDPAEDALTYARTRMDDDHFNVAVKDSAMKACRERIAKKMWTQYVNYNKKS
ncbi:hypothetical protein Pst134EA_009254 [Puccinia striiformis f. sp. tritici]|uniref:hypothetical protein n=1 Tax=Puccinia striiformis f. sp. tritici TaxID=168172 RepID=UPI002007DF38|nr:hypothetical protein Pst134EA_009179 [Puccinia striiformis f. sp. tritici]XP_047808177.1 hypothetical protein Pst134EA_009254 [Puccinia striiformis f. sp. tritici]KAH9458017.1 hypothetical protein Pst134EB_010320 [Puccinia striiformis f. sp. tritici]KAH9468646.1 hypothetical protein Pst134EA_009179 [Puccinia striiformis f. sp. tritici]KAH9468723.1 hypothetical protein Pst134EA_009254 [Puccinia striiformis f. sp. tritici]